MKTLIAILQILCIIIVSTGIFIEVKYKADFGFILISFGAFIFACIEKVNESRLNKTIKNLNNGRNKNKKKTTVESDQKGLRKIFATFDCKTN